MGACRAAITAELARMKPSGPLYHSASTVVAAIDGFVLMLTGKRDYFWEPMRTSRSDRTDGDEN